MSEYLFILKTSGVRKLRESLDNNDNLARYKENNPDWSSCFNSDEDLRQTQVKIVGGNLSKCFGAEDYSSIKILENEPARCEKIYNALKNLTPKQATDERVWVYLTHFVFWDYARARWPIAESEEQEDKQKSIKTHFFIGGLRGMIRDNAISRLWWMAHVCSRVKDCSLKDALSALLYKEDARKEIMERATFCRSEIIFNSLMKFVLRSYHGNKQLHERGTFRELCKYLNRVGGVRVLDSLGADKLDDMIEKIISDELKIDPKFESS